MIMARQIGDYWLSKSIDIYISSVYQYMDQFSYHYDVHVCTGVRAWLYCAIVISMCVCAGVWVYMYVCVCVCVCFCVYICVCVFLCDMCAYQEHDGGTGNRDIKEILET